MRFADGLISASSVSHRMGFESPGLRHNLPRGCGITERAATIMRPRPTTAFVQPAVPGSYSGPARPRPPSPVAAANATFRCKAVAESADRDAGRACARTGIAGG